MTDKQINTTMTDKQINTTLATACGWTQIHEPGLPGLVVGKAPEHYQGQPTSYPIEPVGVWWEIPDYCNDLNHIRSLLIKSSEEHLLDHMLYLLDVINRHPDRSKWTVCADLIRASPRQHAEAFLRTMNLWEE